PELICLAPCNDFDIVVAFNSSWSSFVPVDVVLSFPSELGVAQKRSNVVLKPRDTDKMFLLRFHVNKGIGFRNPMSLGVITVRSDQETLIWNSLPKAVLAGEGKKCHTYLGIMVKLAEEKT